VSADDIEVGDSVRIGKGKTLWTVLGFWTGHDGIRYASLFGGGGYSGTSADPDRLTIVTKAGAA
jgi:hypothetical protein